MTAECIQRLEDISVVLSNGAANVNPKAQMWMGTYPKNPSYVISTGLPLADYLKQNAQVIGKAALDRWGAEIPFLPKVSHYNLDVSREISLLNETKDSLIFQSSPTSDSS
jgi:mannose-6-phosphate isomerase class I